jgi:hypothetical protein
MEQINNFTLEAGHHTEVVVKSKPQPLYHYEVIKNGRVIGHIKTIDRKFIEYLYGLGVKVRAL